LGSDRSSRVGLMRAATPRPTVCRPRPARSGCNLQHTLQARPLRTSTGAWTGQVASSRASHP